MEDRLFSGIKLLFGLFFSGLVFAGYQEGYRMNSSGTIYIKDMADKGQYDDGYQVINSGNNEYFIPTNTQEEWDLFKNNTPSEVEINDVRNGGWSAESSSSGGCSASCGWGSRSIYYSKSCTNPSPANGGDSCSGSATRSSSAGCYAGSCYVPPPYVPPVRSTPTPSPPRCFTLCAVNGQGAGYNVCRTVCR